MLPFLISHLSVAVLALEHGLWAAVGLLLYVLMTRIGNQRRTPTSALAWIMLLGLLPYLGIPLFLFFGNRKFPRPQRQTRTQPLVASVPARPNVLSNLPPNAPSWAVQLLDSMQMPAVAAATAVRFHSDGNAAQAALEKLFSSARSEILLCCFTLGADDFGRMVIEALAAAAHRGVVVRLLLDAVGTPFFRRAHLRPLKETRVEVRWFMPLLHNPLQGRINLRNHRKMVLVDHDQMWSGGRNLAREYFWGDSNTPAWIDLSYEITGPAVTSARALFWEDWNWADGHHFRRLPATAGSPAVGPSRQLESAAPVLASSLPSSPVPSPATPPAPALPQPPSLPQVTYAVQLIPSGPNLADDTLYDLLLSAAYQARRQIVAVTPYFVPDDPLLSAWGLACRRGVRFTLILPLHSNHRWADWAREPALRDLAQAGAQIVVIAQMVHAKLVVIDDQLALCGSCNLDGRSLFLNFELMTAFYGQEQISWLLGWARQLRATGQAYPSLPPHPLQQLREGLARFVGFQL